MENVAGLRCPNCSTIVYPSAGVTPVCPSCGFTDKAPPTWNMPPPTPAPTAWNTSGGYAPAPPAHYPQTYPVGKAPPTQGVAIVALLLNIIIWPGLGSLIAGRSVGWGQGFLFLLSIPLMFIVIGIPLAIGAWIWGIVTGVELINEASQAQQQQQQYR